MSSLSPLPVCFVCFVFMVEVIFQFPASFAIPPGSLCLFSDDDVNLYTLELSEKREPQLRK